VAIQVVPDKAIAMMDNYAQLDVVKSFTTRAIVVDYLEEQGREQEVHRRRIQNRQYATHELLDEEGIDLFRRGDTQGAASRFRRAIEMVPTYAYSWTNLAACHIRWQQFDSALACLKIADGNNPYNPTTYLNFGEAYMLSGDSEEAEWYFRETIRLDPGNYLARGDLIRLFHSQNRQQELDSLMNSLAADPNTPAAYLAAVAEHKLRQGRLQAGASLFNRAIQQGLDSASVATMLGKYPQLVPNQ
jgi:tetratricopeptide (TPR) repeat protein